MDGPPAAPDDVPAGPLRLGPDAIRQLVHYLHPIPVGKGFHLDYVRRTYPGWTWDRLMGALRASGVLRRSCGHPPFRCDPHLAWLEICCDGTTKAVWLPGTPQWVTGDRTSGRCTRRRPR